MNNGLFLNSDDDAPGSGIRFGESKPLFDPDDPKPHVVGPTAFGVLNWEWNAAYNDMRRREAGVMTTHEADSGHENASYPQPHAYQPYQAGGYEVGGAPGVSTALFHSQFPAGTFSGLLSHGGQQGMNAGDPMAATNTSSNTVSTQTPASRPRGREIGGHDDDTNSTSSLVGFPEEHTERVTGRNWRYLTECEKQQIGPYVDQKIDLDNIKLHEGEYPWWLPGDMGGVTLGNHIYFKPGQYDPTTPKGIGLLGHEVVHVGQFQNGMTRLSYVLSALRHGYWQCPEEQAAYDLEPLIRGKATGCLP
ncbi:hypothetical protein JCM15519_19750 [Fundidesulfovibrio butyratiphilus]